MCDVPFPGFDSLFAIRDPLATWPFRATLGGRLPVDPRDGSENPIDLLRGEATTDLLIATHVMGDQTPGDVVWTTWGSILLLSDRVVGMLRVAGLSGWTTLPARIEGAADSRLYAFLVVRGRCGPLDWARSSRVSGAFPGGRFPLLRGFFFDEDSWDGSDFFMEERRSGWVFVTRRVVDLFRMHKIRNVQFERMDELEIPPEAITE
jgi:hypothetical protein